MVCTRGEHVASVGALPSASWAVFFLAGALLRPPWMLPLLFGSAAPLIYSPKAVLIFCPVATRMPRWPLFLCACRQITYARSAAWPVTSVWPSRCWPHYAPPAHVYPMEHAHEHPEQDDAHYRERAQRKKEVVDRRIARAVIDRGVPLVNTGNGKGKSSSGVGMLARSLGHGLYCGVVHFIKGPFSTGEEAFFRRFPNCSMTT